MTRILSLPSILTLMIIVALGFVTVPVNAVDLLDPVCSSENIRSLPNSEKPAACKDNKATSPDSPIVAGATTVIRILSIVLGVIAVVVIIISGLRFIISAGDSASIASARRSLIFALVGLGVVVAAQFIVTFVIARLF